jgi:hypothetical protein
VFFMEAQITAKLSPRSGVQGRIEGFSKDSRQIVTPLRDPRGFALCTEMIIEQCTNLCFLKGFCGGKFKMESQKQDATIRQSIFEEKTYSLIPHQ